jgi:uncharacterized small protein (TIGR04563 family)
MTLSVALEAVQGLQRMPSRPNTFAPTIADKPAFRRSEVTVSMSGTDKRKQSLYFPESMLQDIQKEAARLDRSLSWIVQRCVKIGLPDIRKLPSVNEIPDDDVPGANNNL